MKALLILSVCILVSAANSLTHDQEFQLFKAKFGKVYESDVEERKRFQIFSENLKQIAIHNKKGLWQEGVTKFTDLTKEEFKAQHLNGYVNMLKTQTPLPEKDIDIRQLPASIDWRDSGAVSPVKDQMSCGSCWAFTTVETVESYTQINTGVLPILSAQQVTSCALNGLRCGGTGGCAGSVVEMGLTYSQLFPLTTDAEYPYMSGLGDTGECVYDPEIHSRAAQVMGYELLPRNNYDVILNHLATEGPLAVAVDASAWGNYRGGIFSGCDFGQNIAINHAVQLVGYGSEVVNNVTQKYWLVRNSWDSSWGEEGYIRLERNDEALCGVDNTPLFGVSCINDGDTYQNVCGQCGILYDAVYPIGAFLPPPAPER